VKCFQHFKNSLTLERRRNETHLEIVVRVGLWPVSGYSLVVACFKAGLSSSTEIIEPNFGGLDIFHIFGLICVEAAVFGQ